MSFAKCTRWVGLALLVAAYGTGQASAQDANATITGTVADDQGSVLPGATVTVVNEANKQMRTGVSDGRGDFRFPTLIPGTYTIKIEMQGFKSFERRANVLNASSTLSLGAVKLSLGALSETVIVEAGGTKVNAEDSQHSGLLTSTQIENLQSKGRDVMNLLRTVPGVRYGEDTDAVGDSFGTEVPNVSGQRAHWNRVTVDGLNGNELSGSNRIGSAVNLDAISEVKVLLNTYKAEYGGTGGASIQIVSKGGTSDYRGNLYWYGRRTSWNANTWENNLNSAERGIYKYNTYGFNIGGPVPGQKEKKLFFFYSLEAPLLTTPRGGLRAYMMPTEAERRGDFSQTFPYGNPTGKPTIVDPVTGTAFTNNIIPADRINKSMQALMNLMPLPNQTDLALTKGNYNYTVQNVLRNPRQNHLLRFDWKPSEKDTIFLSTRMHKSLQKGSEGTAGSSDWGFFDSTYDFADKSITLGFTRIFSSSTINEFSSGIRQADEGFGADGDENLNRIKRSTIGYTAGQFFPGQNQFDAVPRVQLDNLESTGVTAPDFSYDNRLGETAHDYVFMFRDNVTLTKSAHTYKAGFNFERVYNNEARGGEWSGNYQFSNSSRTTNPFAAGHTYANMIMGVFNNYTENETYRRTANRQNRLEGYIQDTWKATRRLTLDLGVRFLWFTPYKQAGGTTAAFVPSRYVASAAPRLYTPATGGVAVDPGNPNDRRTPAAAFQGRFVPGTGNQANGMVTALDTDYPLGFRDNQGIHPEPRIGLAYDVFGNGKTAVHTGFGLSHQGYLGGGSQGNLQGPPNFNAVSVPNGIQSQLLNSIGLASPPGVNGLERDAKTPAAYNFSFGVQHEVGWGTVVDATYVGVLNRHTEMQVNYNYIPQGAKLAGSTVIETPVRTIQTRNPLNGNALYPDQWLRPYFGFGDITIRENWGTANYNALQFQLNRRYIKGLQFGVSYTFSKSLGVGDEDPARFDPRLDPKQFYSPARHNQTHNAVLNFSYEFPKLSKLVSAAPVKFVFDNWQISGEYVRASGDWAGIALSLNPGQDFTGGTNCDFGATGSGYTGCSGGATAVMTKNPRKKGGDPFDPNNPWFDVTAFARPSADNLGNTPRTVIQKPPINSLNASLFKNFPIGKRRRVQLRLEGYNVLNHTQIRDVNRTATFDAAGNQTNTNFGLAVRTGTATRPPRILQASFRLSF